jgi:hypothetical protein
MALHMPRNNARAVVILQQEDGTYMAYRVIPTELEIRPDYDDRFRWSLTPSRTRITLEGELIDGMVWQPPEGFFPDQPQIEGQRPAITDTTE